MTQQSDKPPARRLRRLGSRLLKSGAALLLLALSAAGCLWNWYPFVFQELATLPSMLIAPEFQQPNPAITTISKLDDFAAAQFRERGVPGAAVAIVANGKVVWSTGYGLANVETQQPATADTPFMVGSVSKAVMGVTLMHAVENGHVELDANVNTYLPFDVRNPQLTDDHAVTLRHLATHTSGIIDRDWLYVNSYEFGDPTVGLEEFLQDYLVLGGSQFRPADNFLNSEPGAATEYSNIAAALAGHVIHEATGTRLDRYAAEHVFVPLGMSNTGWFLSDFADPSLIAQPYAFGNRAFPHYGYPTWPDGQLRTSANDLARLLAMVMNRGECDGVRILTTESVNRMLTKQSLPGLSSVAGEGIFWSYTRGGMLGHNGGDPGVTSAMYFLPDRRIGVVVLANASLPRALEPVFNVVRQILKGSTTDEVIASLP